MLLGLLAPAALAQDDQPTAPAPNTFQAAPPAPPEPDIGPAVQGPPKIAKPKPKPKPAEAPIPIPTKPELIRSPVAVFQVLDKVTAETMRFEAPVGRPVRYKNLVVQVRACETRDYDAPAPRASAYLLIDTHSVGPNGRAADNQVFHGWIFAYTPSLRALHHPIYDLWLIACSAAAPAS